ncbi:MAG TPA: alpha/beta hydrolase, partial [Epulopiscium sp.]|nr:alpha/beta hydrolase [Candidatus Epulonipiscium sp.]
PGIVDTDGDGYSDEEDLAPKKKFMTPVVLLHGRTSDTYETFGAVTKIHTGKKYKASNGHYGKEASENGLRYKETDSHKVISTQKPKKITRKQPTNLAYEMENRAKEPYVINKNLFAFNYPNLDMTSQNGLKFEAYLENLADYMKKLKNDNMFYPTKESRDNKDYKVNLIGHSNGGLVSRYFIENLGNSNVVDKLITIDTPHFGSGFATVTGKVQVPLPIDVDLSPENQIFGGTKVNYGLNGSYVDDRVRYINKNQTQELKYWNHGTTKYYFIAGYDAKALSRVPIEYLNKNMPFELDIDYATTFGQYKDAIKNSFIKNSEYGDLADDDIFKKVFDLKYSYGDNVVNNQSQLGLVFESDKEDGKVEKKIKTQGKWMNIDTHMGDWVASHFHGDNQHRAETINQVFKYLK